MSAEPDAIVVGAGICGAAVAHFLAARGRSVLVLDRAGISGGTTGLGEGNVLVCDKPPGTERELAVTGRELWERLGESFPTARVTRKGALLLDAPGGVDLGGLEPALAPGVRGWHEPADLQVDAAAMTHALLEEIDVRTAAEVVAVGAGEVRLAGGERLSARDVVVATGPWAGTLTGLPVAPRKGQLVALAAPPGLIRHKLIEAAYMDAVGDRGDALQVATVIEQTLDGDEVLVGSSRARVGFDATIDPAVTAAMLERARRFVPALAGLAVTRVWCGFRPWLPDGLPAVGALAPGRWVTTGHEGSGICLGPVTGLLLAQLICGEAPACDPAPLDPLRFAD